MLGLISIALVVVVSILVSIDRKLKIMLDKKWKNREYTIIDGLNVISINCILPIDFYH